MVSTLLDNWSSFSTREEESNNKRNLSVQVWQKCKYILLKWTLSVNIIKIKRSADPCAYWWDILYIVGDWHIARQARNTNTNSTVGQALWWCVLPVWEYYTCTILMEYKPLFFHYSESDILQNTMVVYVIPWFSTPGLLCNIGYPSETHLKLKSHEISFVHNIRFSCTVVLKFCTEHSITVVLSAQF